MRQVLTPNNGALHSVPQSHRILTVLPDNPTGLAIVRCLGQHGITVFSACHPPWGGRKPMVAHSRYCSGGWILDAGPTGWELIDEVRALAVQLYVGSIMAMMEPHICMLVRHRERFPKNIHLFIPPTESFEKAVDKDYMHHLCMQLGIPVARSTTLDKFMTCDNGSSLAFPLALRARNKHLTSQDSKPPWKVAYARDQQELRELYDGYEAVASNIIVQEYHPGMEYFVQALMHKSKRIADGGFMGEHALPLVMGGAVRRVTFQHEQMRQDSVRMLKAIGYDGIAGVQFHYDPETGKYIFLEVNPRFFRSVAIVIKAGFDVPYLLWQSYFEPEKIVTPQYREGLRMRSFGDDIWWMCEMLKGEQLPPDQKRLGKISAVWRFLWHLGPWTQGEVFLWRDLRPYWIIWKGRMSRFVRWLFARV